MKAQLKLFVRNTINKFRFKFKRQRGTLVYAGIFKGGGLNSIFVNYERCYAFEANPELYRFAKKKYEKFPSVTIINAVVADYDGEIDFNISSNGGASSSIGHFSEDWENHASGQIKMEKTVKLPCINICNFLRTHGIEYVDDYVSDIQGFDLEVLKTLKPYLDEKRIGTITCEVAKSRNIYKDLPDNSEEGFNKLLGNNYECVGTGWGHLREGEFQGTPEAWWEMDCKWRLKA